MRRKQSVALQFTPTSSVCPTCCNLDARKSPPDPPPARGGLSWAEQEYKVPAGGPAGKILLEDSDILIQSAKRGCFYCGMVQTALMAAHPGWDKEKTAMEVYLALGLPVVVVLMFGSIATVKTGPEQGRNAGFHLGEGEGLTHTIWFSLSDSPDTVEVEIFRPVPEPDEALPNGTSTRTKELPPVPSASLLTRTHA